MTTYFFSVILGYLLAVVICIINDHYKRGRGEEKEEQERETVEELKKKYTRKGEVIEWH